MNCNPGVLHPAEDPWISRGIMQGQLMSSDYMALMKEARAEKLARGVWLQQLREKQPDDGADYKLSTPPPTMIGPHSTGPVLKG